VQKEHIRTQLRIDDEDCYVYVLPEYGTIVFWGVPSTEMQQIEVAFRNFAESPFGMLPNIFPFFFSFLVANEEKKHLSIRNSFSKSIGADAETEELPFKEHNFKTEFVRGKILLGEQRKFEEMLIFSNAMARSVLISVFENRVREIVERLRSVAVLLSRQGHWSRGSRHRLTKELGLLLDLRYRVNISDEPEVGDKPNECWEDPVLEDLFTKISRELEIPNRIETINERINHAKELNDELLSSISQSHSNFLEWIIIILIAVEVFFGLEQRGFFMGWYWNYKRLPEHENPTKKA
jgi:uncharacterized Rmd1/YagE family protein